MKKIKRYLLAIFIMLVAIYINGLQPLYMIPRFVSFIGGILPLASIAVLIPNFFEKDD